MNDLFVLLFLVSFVACIVGLVSPRKVLRGDGKKSRGRVLKIYGVITVALFILVGISAPKKHEPKRKIKPEFRITKNVPKEEVGIIPLSKSRKVAMNPTINSNIQPEEPVFVSASYYEIRDNMEKLTDLQFKEYVKNYNGKWVSWEGYIEEVKEKMFGGLAVWIDMDSPDEIISVQDIELLDIPKETALKLKKDDMVQFKGKIRNIFNILSTCQITIADAQIMSYESPEKNIPPNYNSQTISEPELTWNYVEEWTGKNKKNTETFHIPSREWRISWESEGGHFGLVLHRADGKYVELVANVVDGEGETSIMRGKGDYYFAIDASEEYTITVEAKY